ncbi:TSC22 domain family protein 2 TSC22-related-inducible leucine zipper protein 4 [Takifugu flavidus]|uniref:TSC22 domain family protein 2 TSC22-related-inducible leucine zipper protein 4 n=1 Tax=Takifugu flavidus TaxID=433684 RepID=A0A5C6P255_9TELE|nr:TSC22 domain family protein 2 TSC22-related-inducible leucine zipper protein 4 [Takifugu flavidus]
MPCTFSYRPACCGCRRRHREPERDAPGPLLSGRTRLSLKHLIRAATRVILYGHRCTGTTGRGFSVPSPCHFSPRFLSFHRASGTNVAAIDNKIEQAMDLVKSHLMYAVREEVEVLKEQIKELFERNSVLERENAVLKSLANSEQLSQLPSQSASGPGCSPPQQGLSQPPQQPAPPQAQHHPKPPQPPRLSPTPGSSRPASPPLERRLDHEVQRLCVSECVSNPSATVKRVRIHAVGLRQC